MNPLSPGTKKAPTGQRLNVSLAFANNKNRWQRAAFRINKVIEKLPNEKLDVPKDEAPKVSKSEKRRKTLSKNKACSAYLVANSEFELPLGTAIRELRAMQVNATRYEYKVDAQSMDRTMAAIELILTQDILDGSTFWTKRFFLNDYINSAAKDGVTDSFDSAVRITEGSPVEKNLEAYSAQQQLNSPAYLDRLKLVNGRVFESMKSLTADMKSQLRVTLTEGMARGVGIRDLKGMVNNRLGIGMVRAERIARTEVNQAYRTAYMDEATELNKTALDEGNWQIMQAHRSALSPTTRPKHGARHGTVHTVQQQKDWWATDANAINCLCSTLDVLVDKKTGEILQQNMLDRMAKQKAEWFPMVA